MNYMTNGYLGSYLGYQCNLPLELAEYKFRNEDDVKDWISLCNSTETAFKTYITFTEKQAEKGYAMPDFVIDNVVSQCEEFVNIKETNYLIDIFNDKVDADLNTENMVPAPAPKKTTRTRKTSTTAPKTRKPRTTKPKTIKKEVAVEQTENIEMLNKQASINVESTEVQPNTNNIDIDDINN